MFFFSFCDGVNVWVCMSASPCMCVDSIVAEIKKYKALRSQLALRTETLENIFCNFHH